MFLIIYNIVIRLFAAGIRIASFWNPKARLWVKGRKQIFSRVAAAMRGNSKPVVWMHSASLGEFEQGRFLLENLRDRYPGACIVLTFFSPSGYEIAKQYKGADHIFYLPLPTGSNARRFIGLLNPSLVLWIKYDYWYHYLHTLRKRNIPLLLVSAIFHRRQTFFRWYGLLHRKMLHCFTWIFVQTPASARLLRKIGFDGNVSVSGDTRFDRVIDIASHHQGLPLIEAFTASHPVIVAGSTWPEDEEELDHFANTNAGIRFIIAPHELGEDHLRDIEKLFKNCVRYSALQAGAGVQATTLIIDNIGMLSRLYHYATITYVGGGFGDAGIHNILEAAVYGKPVIFGPVFNKHREAIELLEEGAAFTVETALELEAALNKLLANRSFYDECCTAAREYVYANKGATEHILGYIQENRLLTS